MIIKSVEFAGAIASPGGPAPGDLPQIAFSGRSNVGKSSLINRLLGRTRSFVARVSSTPGKTQEINFYRVRGGFGASEDGGEGGGEVDFFLVDLPGYGYAKVPLAVKERWRPLIEGYLGDTPPLRGVVQLLDARHDPTDDDRRILEYLAGLELPTLLVLTKIDKLGREQRRKRFDRVIGTLGLDPEQVLPFSSTSGEGRDSLLSSIEDLLKPGDQP